jgi:hypothetical protein
VLSALVEVLELVLDRSIDPDWYYAALDIDFRLLE